MQKKAGRIEPAAAAEVSVPAGDRSLAGVFSAPSAPLGVVVFAHGSGSSRLSPRNRMVSDVLNGHGFATLLFDLLTPEEAENRGNVFDIDLLADRLAAAVEWVAATCGNNLPIGLFGASTGAAAAMAVAARPHPTVEAVVSRGGRPDLAGAHLDAVTAPTLLVVGGNDRHVLVLNRGALERMQGPAELAVVPGAGHLFAEQGALETVADMATDWFCRHLA